MGRSDHMQAGEQSSRRVGIVTTSVGLSETPETLSRPRRRQSRQIAEAPSAFRNADIDHPKADWCDWQRREETLERLS